jgi:hypothetical protein
MTQINEEASLAASCDIYGKRAAPDLRRRSPTNNDFKNACKREFIREHLFSGASLTPVQ